MAWFYAKDGQRLGPVEQEILISKVRALEITEESLVWREGMSDWTPLGSIPELKETLGQAASTVSGQTPSTPLPQPPSGIPAGQTASANIPSYLWQSIAATVLCCWPAGVVAIIYAAKVDGLIRSGDLVGAQHASKNARLWTIISAVSVFVLIVLYIILGLVIGFDELQ